MERCPPARTLRLFSAIMESSFFGCGCIYKATKASMLLAVSLKRTFRASVRFGTCQNRNTSWCRSRPIRTLRLCWWIDVYSPNLDAQTVFLVGVVSEEWTTELCLQRVSHKLLTGGVVSVKVNNGDVTVTHETFFLLQKSFQISKYFKYLHISSMQ